MSKYNFIIEPKQNSYEPSNDYGKVFGWNVIDVRSNRVVKTFLIHETDLMLAYYPFSRKVKNYAKRVEETKMASF